MNAVTLLTAIDPGNSTGWAKFEIGNTQPLEFGVLTEDEFFPWLSKECTDIFVVENYRIRPASKSGWTHQFGTVLPAQLIGAIRLRAYESGAEIVLQEPSVKSVGFGFLGTKPPSKSNPLNHAYDAISHGIYFIMKNGLNT